MESHLEDIAAYQKALDFSERIVALTESFPQNFYFLTAQLNAAALAIAANLAEANGRDTPAESKPFLETALTSAKECLPFLEMAKKQRIVRDIAHAELRERVETLSKMITDLGTSNRNTSKSL
jgi:four helix bundle protein